MVWYKGLLYQTATWKTVRRMVAKLEFHGGELFPRVEFIVTNLETLSRAVVRFYNKRVRPSSGSKRACASTYLRRRRSRRFTWHMPQKLTPISKTTVGSVMPGLKM